MINKSNIAFGACLFPFCMRNIFTDIKQINKLCRATRFAFQSGYIFFPLHILCWNVYFLFCSFFSPIFVVVLFHFSMCHALRFRSRCINTQFNREFERHLFTYLWFRLKIWKYKFHAYKLEAQSSFFIFRQ